MEMKAQFVLNTNVAAACDPKATRFSLANVHVLPGPDNKAYATASDTKIIAVCPLEGSHVEEPCVLPGKFVKAPKNRREPAYSLNGRWEHGERMTTPLEGQRFPKMPDVLPTGQPAMEVTLDAKLLANLATAIAKDGFVTLFIYDSENAIGAVGDYGIGAIMPAPGQERARDMYNEILDEYRKAWDAAGDSARVPC